MIDSTDLPSIWNIPYQRNEFFTGREDVLSDLYASLQSESTAILTQPQGISGLGGIGKTQTAVEYVYRHHADYNAIFWVRADSSGALSSGFVDIAYQLHLPEKEEQDQSRIVDAVMRWLRKHDHWLLILDNIEDLEVAAPFIPTSGRGHILLTTRAQALGEIAKRIEVQKRQPEIGALFLLRRAEMISLHASLDVASNEDRTLALKISQIMDGLPLALDQAGAYIKETRCSLSDYFSLYQTRSADLLKERKSFDADHPEPVATTWSLSFEKVAQSSAAATELLYLCAFLYPEAIPEEIITDGASELGTVLRPVATDPLQLNSAIKELRRFSLLFRDPDAQTFTIHRLVQTVLKDDMDEFKRQQWAERTVRAVYHVFPTVSYSEWPRCQRCILQAQTCSTLIGSYNMVFPEASQLLFRAGSYLENRGRYWEGEPLLHSVLRICEETLGPDDPQTAQGLSHLARIYWRQGQYEKAEVLMQRALTIRERVLGPEHLETADSLNSLAQIYLDKGQYEQAEPLAQRAFAIREREMGPDDPGILTSLSTLAQFYRERSQYEKAEPLMQRALTICEKVRGPAHPSTSTLLNNLAELYQEQGKYEQAEPLYQRALAISEQVLGY